MSDTQNEAAAAAAKAAPISLPAGCFELSDLEKVAASATKAKPDDRDKIVADGLAKANKDERADVEPNRLPGHKLETVDRVLVEGAEVPVEGGKKGETEIVGEVRVTETIQVFDPAKAEEEAEAAAEAEPVTGLAAEPGTAAKAAG